MIEHLKSKKIAVLGAGANNKSLVQFFAAHDIPYDLFDKWDGHDSLVGKLSGFDIVFRTPGLPYQSKAIQEAKRAGVEISSQTKLFFQLCPASIIGVTGTKGKGTTSALIAKILEAAGKKSWLGGNIGRDPFEFLEQIQKDDFVVLELSSFQLQDLEKSPHVAVVVNLGSDHLDHHQDLEEYGQAKLNILAHQTSTDYAVLNPNLPENFKNSGAGRKIFFNPSTAQQFETQLSGKHNWENIAAAAQTAKILGVDEATIKKAVGEFEPLPHRLSFVKEVKGIRYVDDSYSTNAEATLAALKSFDSNIVLIVGGAQKGIEWQGLGSELASNSQVTGLVVIGQEADKIIAAAHGFKGKVAVGAKTMAEILGQANELAKSGDTVLLSPGTSSFDMFKNATDRGEQFMSRVGGLA